MVKGTTTVQQWTDWEVETVECPNDIHDYQDGMGAVGKGDQRRALGAAFCNVAYFKKWYKKAYFGVADCSMFQSFSTWNLSANELAALWRGGVVHRKRLIKWEFYSVACKEMMTFVSLDEATTTSIL
eukprot:11861020-Ditylum_brightwellii.AAC.1